MDKFEEKERRQRQREKDEMKRRHEIHFKPHHDPALIQRIYQIREQEVRRELRSMV